MKKIVNAMLILIVIGSIVGCQPAKEEDKELQILAAASMTDVLEEVKVLYEKENMGVAISFNFDSSGTLQTQIEEGAPADIFISAAPKQMDELEKKNLVEPKSRIDLLENKIVLIKPTNSNVAINSFEGIAAEEIKLVAIGNEDVPVGQYTKKLYEKLDLWEVIEGKANMATNVRQVLDWVATGNVDCGIVYATDAMTEKKVEVICEASEELVDKVIYPAGIITTSKEKEEAKKFVAFLQTETISRLFETYGFTIYNE